MNNKILVLVVVLILVIAGIIAFRQYRKSNMSSYSLPGQSNWQQQSSGVSNTPSNTTGQPDNASADTTQMDQELQNLDSSLQQQSSDNTNLNF